MNKSQLTLRIMVVAADPWGKLLTAADIRHVTGGAGGVATWRAARVVSGEIWAQRGARRTSKARGGLSV